jgi:D-sedoheptulose 7-phosphate isomerase
MRKILEDYIEHLQEVLTNLDLEAIERFFRLMESCVGTERKIWVMGNGGSAATASHMACDLSKGVREYTGTPIPVMSLTDSVSILTAIANDSSYDDSFSDQLKPYLKKDDVVVVISGSGNSKNVVKAVEYAKEKGATTVALVGYQGGTIKGIADLCVHVRVDDMQLAEDAHLIINHMAMKVFVQRFSKSQAMGAAAWGG